MDERVTEQIWIRLILGQRLDDLGLPMRNGRLDLAGLVAPEPSTVRRFAVATMNMKESSDFIVLKGIHWKGIDFSRAILDSLRFIDCSVDDCCFAGARCQDWRVWGTTISNTSFQSADLRNSALGPVDAGKRNIFDRVDFTNADLRKTVYVSGDMANCIFADAKLSKIDFQGTVFENCTFQGELCEVLFYRQAFRGESFPPNEMKGVDFRRASLRHVEFRGLDMATVQWPEDEGHIVVNDYRTSLDRAINVLKSRGDTASRKLAVALGIKRKWAGPNQNRGVISKSDLIEVSGQESLSELLSLLAPN